MKTRISIGTAFFLAVALGAGCLLPLPAGAQSKTASRRDALLRLDRNQRLKEARERLRDADITRVKEEALNRDRRNKQAASAAEGGESVRPPAAGTPAGAPVSLEAQAARSAPTGNPAARKTAPAASSGTEERPAPSGGAASPSWRHSDITLEPGAMEGLENVGPGGIPTVGGQPAELVLPYQKPESMLPSRLLKTDPKAQTHIRVIAIGEAEFTGEGNLVVFRRDVSVDHPQFVLKCDLLNVYLNEEGEMERAVATGYVQILKKNTKNIQLGKARRAVYLPDTEDVELSEWPQVQHGKNLHLARAANTRMVLYKNGDMKTFGPSESRVLQSTKNSSGPPGGTAPDPGTF